MTYSLEYVGQHAGCKTCPNGPPISRHVGPPTEGFRTRAEAVRALGARAKWSSWPVRGYKIVEDVEITADIREAQTPPAPSVLPVDYTARKNLPVFRGVVAYFPDALLAVAAVSKAGNDQHNPGEPLHWAREKSTENLDPALRHLMDHITGTVRDTDSTYHLAKAAWRILAELQLAIEAERAK